MRRTNEESLKDVLQHWYKNTKLKPKMNLSKINEIWASQMGPTIAGLTRKLFVKQKTLFIYIDSAPLRQELGFGKEKIKKMINEEMGELIVEEVVVR